MSYKDTYLPDVMSQNANENTCKLDWVGMEKISLPVKFVVSDAETVGITASVDIFVSLDTQAKGIHMSRLYLKLQEMLANQALSFNRLNGLLEGALFSQNKAQNNHSSKAMVNIEFDLPLLKPSLVTDNFGYQAYKVNINQQLIDGSFTTKLNLTIPYSSTCPCSVSLTKELIGEAIEQQFAGESLNKADLVNWLTDKQTTLATPHNQRSFAFIELTLAELTLAELTLAPQLCMNQQPDIAKLILQIEQAIGTGLQTAVKRADEQAFAALNGENLMFCEDAARKLAAFLDSLAVVTDYRFKVEHQESLHAHNAVVIHQKGS